MIEGAPPISVIIKNVSIQSQEGTASGKRTSRNAQTSHPTQRKHNPSLQLKQQLESCGIIYGGANTSSSIKIGNIEFQKSPKNGPALDDYERQRTQLLMTPLQSNCESKKLCSFKILPPYITSSKQSPKISSIPTKSIAGSHSPAPLTLTIRNQKSNDSGQLSKAISKSSISKPPTFKLRDLPKYSRTLKERDIKDFKFNQSLLGGKYIKNQVPEGPPSPPKSPTKIEWTLTPVFKQIILQQSEVESLEDSELGFQKYHQEHANTKTFKQILLDLKSKTVRRTLVSQTLSSIYSEPEVEYLITITKKKNINDPKTLQGIYEKALLTLEVLMCKLGLRESYKHLAEAYQKEAERNQRQTLIKILHRCLMMYVSLLQVQLIFKLIKKRDQLETKIKEYDEKYTRQETQQESSQEGLSKIDEGKEQTLESLEQSIAMYCYQSSRLFIQISSFMIESNLFKRLKFIYEGSDYQAKIRRQMTELKEQYQRLFATDSIPEMNSNGKLVFPGTESAEQVAQPGQEGESQIARSGGASIKI